MQNIIELVTNHPMEDNASLTRIALYLGLYVNTILFYLGLGVFLNYAHKCFDTQCQGRLYMDVFRRTSDFDYEIFEDASFLIRLMEQLKVSRATLKSIEPKR